MQERGRWDLFSSGFCSAFINSSLVLMTLGRTGEHRICVPGIKSNQKKFPVFTGSVKSSCHCKGEGKNSSRTFF